MSAPVPDLVGRVVVRGVADTPAVRLEARARVGRLRLGPAGRSQHEILIVRSLRLEGTHLDGQLAQARRVAVPLDGRAVPAGAVAVVAADLAQLLAQYCDDLHHGALTRHWWWKVVSGRLPRGPVTAVLGAHPAEAPHVVADLVRTRRTESLHAASSAAVIELLRLLAREHDAPRLEEMLRRAATSTSPADEPDAPPADVGATPSLTGGDLLVLVATRLADDVLVSRSAEFARFVAVAAGLPAIAVPSPRASPPQSAPVPEASAPLVRGHDGSMATREHARLPARGDTSAERSPFPGSSWAVPPRPVAGEDQQRDRSTSTEQRNTAPPHEPFPVPSASRQPSKESDTVSPAGLVTELGGVFFLIHALDDLTPPVTLVDAVGPWGVLDLAARWLVDGREELMEDGIWALLADLGGARLADRTARLPATIPTRWQDRSVRRVARQLSERLDVEVDDLVDTLLVRPARVTWDRTHVDVALPLTAACVPVRRAGLDRDPGWVPSLARAVAFHFDDGQFAGAPT